LTDGKVGYGKPPRETRFKKGFSVNPKGRPKASKEQFGSVLRDIFNREVEFMENGKPKRASILEIIVMQVAVKAVKGEKSAGRMLLQLLENADSHGDINPLVLVFDEGFKNL
jgi:hypothetical protein